MQIAGRTIGPDAPPFIVAEVGCNHGGSLERALALIDAAKACGADAVKFQAYTADTITIPGAGPEFTVADGPWAGKGLHALYKACETPFDWFPHIAKHARKAGIIWFASVFDKTSVDMLNKLRVPAFKIASFELIDYPLIRYAGSKKKPTILSVGMSSDLEIDDAWRVLESSTRVYLPPDEHGEIFDETNGYLLHCISGYPTPVAQANLHRMTMLQRGFPRVGISDHTTGIEVPIAATALGASIIEKHFALPGCKTEDAAFSLRPAEFTVMVESVRNTWAALQPTTATSEAAQRPLRRSLYAVADIAAGEAFTEANVRSIRPGAGLPPKDLDRILGKTAACDIAYGTPLAWDLVSSSSAS